MATAVDDQVGKLAEERPERAPTHASNVGSGGEGIIKEGSTVIFRKDRILKPCVIERGKKIKLDRSGIIIDAVIGTAYGSHFELRKGRLHPVGDGGPGCQARETKLVETGTDNRDLRDDAGKSQMLTQEEIVEMKSSGMSGQDIVTNVVENSVTFSKKTEYSKKKYIDKKRKTHIQLVTVLKPSTRLLCEMYYAKSPGKILYMRHDTVARILTACNVHANTRLVAVDTTQGLLLASLLERMGGLGKLVHIFPGDRPVRMALEQSGHVPENYRTILMDYPLNRVNQLLDLYKKDSKEFVAMEMENNIAVPTKDSTGNIQEKSCLQQDPLVPIQECVHEHGNGSGNVMVDSSLNTSEVDEDTENSGVDSPSENSEDDDEPKSKKRCTARKQISFEERMSRKAVREEQFAKSREELLKGCFDGLLVATRFHPEPIVLSLLPFLSPSRPFVVYCPFIEPLANMYTELKERCSVFDLHLSDTWLRQYQVLPLRTHPLNQMSGGGGYILTGLTIAMET